VFKNAEECLNMVSERLGSTNTYLFGMAPSSADAILYGYLAPLIKAPFPNPSLQNHVKANDNLWKFVSHINLTYFAKVASDYQRYLAILELLIFKLGDTKLGRFFLPSCRFSS
jgi:metaxin